MAAKKEEESAPAEAPRRAWIPLVGVAVGALVLGGGGGYAASVMLGGSTESAAAEGEGEGGGEEAAAEGGGHGEAPAAGGHGEAKAESGGHGEAKAESGGHGEAKAESGGHGGGEAKATKPGGITGDSVVQTLGQFTVNLRGTGGGRVLRMEVQVETSADDAVTIEARKAMLRDAVLTLASDYAYADVEGLDGKMRLRDELLGRLNVLLGKSATVQRIYFTEFVVQ